MTFNVFIVDDHEVVRRGLIDLINAEDDLHVVGDAGNVHDALQKIVDLQPHVAVLDVRLPDGSGVELCREVRSIAPNVHTLMLTSYADDEALLGAILAGASGYALKDIKGEDLLNTIRIIARGDSTLDAHAAERVRSRLRKAGSAAAELDDLTDQERRVIELIGEGLTNRQIAERMSLAEKTVKNYVSSLLAKLGLERRTQAAALAVRLGLRSTSN